MYKNTSRTCSFRFLRKIGFALALLLSFILFDQAYHLSL